MPLFADQLETCRDIAKRWVIPGSRFCHACRLGRRYRLICGAGIGTRVRGLPIGVNFKGAGVGRPLTGEGARPRAPQRRAKLTDVFRPLDRQTRSASGTIPRPRDGDAIPPSAGSGRRLAAGGRRLVDRGRRFFFAPIRGYYSCPFAVPRPPLRSNLGYSLFTALRLY
jgi:hypothetical protein